MKEMRDSWDNKLKETLDSLSLSEGLPSWDDFVSSRGLAESPPQTAIQSSLNNFYWAAALLAGVLAFAGIYWTLNEPDTPAPYSFNPDTVIPAPIANIDNNKEDLQLENDTTVIKPIKISVSKVTPSNEIIEEEDAINDDLIIEPEPEKVYVQTPTKKPVVNNGPFAFDDGETDNITVKPVVVHKSSLDVYALGMGSVGSNDLFNSDIQASDYISEASTSHMDLPPNVSALDHKMPMIFGLKLRKKWTDRWGWEAGVFYSCYISEGRLDGFLVDYSYKQNLQYMGVSSGINYDLFPGRKLNLSLFTGLSSEIAVSAKGTFKVSPENISVNDNNVKLSTNGVLFSCYGGTSIAYEFLPGWALAAEPGFRSTFDNLGHPESYRSKHPVYFTLTFGIRKNL